MTLAVTILLAGGFVAARCLRDVSRALADALSQAAE
jgi:hypothetical protein